MNLKSQYETLSKWCYRRLHKKYHGRHLEDLIQHVAMEAFANASYFERFGLQGRWDWYLANYCRENGLSAQKGKLSAETMEKANFVGEETWKLENKCVEKTSPCKSFLEEMDYFLSNLNLKKDAYLWAMKEQEKRLSRALIK